MDAGGRSLVGLTLNHPVAAAPIGGRFGFQFLQRFAGPALRAKEVKFSFLFDFKNLAFAARALQLDPDFLASQAVACDFQHVVMNLFSLETRRREI
jgi:hypothetical protein